MRNARVDALIAEVGLPRALGKCLVAGIIFTYRCSIACRHCLFHCGGDQPDVAMTPRQCADALAMLHETPRVVHIAGGEAMLYWDALSDAIRLAHGEGNAPHFIETNCSFASNDAVVRERFGFLAAHGVTGIYASADPFHQEFVPADRFLRVRRLAREIFGPANFIGPDGSDADIEALAAVARDEARLRSYLHGREPMMVGRAQKMLARHLEDCATHGEPPPSSVALRSALDSACLPQFKADTLWEFHIDPYGNIQTNCGILLGRVAEVRPRELLARGPEKANRFVEAVCAGGAMALAELARRERGFVLPERVSQKCELCYLARRFLRTFHPDVFGPAEVYA